ncbi:DoxX family protein [Nocardia sp. NPDC046763]|uniref:DoxX family protein n=1 Tax=Nocardia sp. NPDC046763 TaxID=3155256 RepID=UPI00340557B0
MTPKSASRWKLLGSTAILVPGFSRPKEWAYAGMFFNMTGAFISHLVERDYGTAGMHLTVTAGIVGTGPRVLGAAARGPHAPVPIVPAAVDEFAPPDPSPLP